MAKLTKREKRLLREAQKQEKLEALRSKIHPSQLPLSRIQVQTPHQNHVSFSFKYLLDKPKEFDSTAIKSLKYWQALKEKLVVISEKTKQELLDDNSDYFRFHPINWKDTSQKNGFQRLDEQLQGHEPFQFNVRTNNFGRVHGFFIDNVFHIVWLDRDHKLYPRK